MQSARKLARGKERSVSKSRHTKVHFTRRRERKGAKSEEGRDILRISTIKYNGKNCTPTRLEGKEGEQTPVFSERGMISTLQVRMLG